MPTIQIFTAEHGPGVFQAPHVPPPIPIESGGEALTQAGVRFMEIGQQLRAQQDKLDLYRTVTETETELQQYRQDFSVDTDYETQAERFVKLANEVKYRKLGTLRSPSVAAVYQAQAERMIAETGIHVRADANKRIVERQHIETGQLVEKAAGRWALAETPEKRAEITKEVIDLVSGSIFDPKDKYRFTKGFEERGKAELKTLVKERIENDADGTQKALLAGAYDGVLDKQDIVELRNTADRQQRENREEARLIEHDRQEQANITVFELYRAGKLTPTGIAKSKLPPEKQIFWENALEHKRDQPYRVSNLDIKASVLKTILSHPEQISGDAILAKMGKGLSIDDAGDFHALWKKVTSSSIPAEYDPLRQALSIWEDQRKLYTFTPDAMLQDAADVRSGTAKPGPKLTLENDLASQKILDTLILRAGQGEEPRAVLRELMKPYVDREIASWSMFSPSTWLPVVLGKPSVPATGVADERQQAIKFLQGNNVTPTEENIRRSMNFLKKKGVK